MMMMMMMAIEPECTKIEENFYASMNIEQWKFLSNFSFHSISRPQTFLPFLFSLYVDDDERCKEKERERKRTKLVRQIFS